MNDKIIIDSLKGTYKIEYDDVVKYYNKNGKFHREDGPAVEYSNGYKAWYQDDKLHREDGPAIEHANGDKSWYINGKELSEEQFNKLSK